MSSFNEDVYIDLQTANVSQSVSNQRVALQFQKNFSQPVLNNTNGYKLTITRFVIETTQYLPIWIPLMRDNDDVETIYSVTMDYNGETYQQYMEFIPQTLNVTDPDEKFYVFNYQYVTYLITQCLQSCFTALSGLTALPIGSVSPSLSFDPSTQRCTLSWDSTYFGYNETGKINLYMNYAMYTLLSGLPAIMINTNVLGKDYQINNLMSSDPDNLTQDYSTITSWNPIGSMVFTTNLLPVYSSVVPPSSFYTDGVLNNSNTNYNALNIVTDFIADELNFVPYVQYSPSIFRYICLQPNAQLRTIDLSVYWSNKLTDKLKPVYIPVGSSCSVKLFFTTNFT